MGEDEEPDLDIISKIDKIMSGESEERKNLVKAIVDFSDEDILLLDKIIKGLGTKKPININRFHGELAPNI